MSEDTTDPGRPDVGPGATMVCRQCGKDRDHHFGRVRPRHVYLPVTPAEYAEIERGRKAADEDREAEDGEKEAAARAKALKTLELDHLLTGNGLRHAVVGRTQRVEVNPGNIVWVDEATGIVFVQTRLPFLDVTIVPGTPPRY